MANDQDSSSRRSFDTDEDISSSGSPSTSTLSSEVKSLFENPFFFRPEEKHFYVYITGFPPKTNTTQILQFLRIYDFSPVEGGVHGLMFISEGKVVVRLSSPDYMDHVLAKSGQILNKKPVVITRISRGRGMALLLHDTAAKRRRFSI